MIQAPAAWSVSQGQGIVVEVVDTGLDATHPDIQGNFEILPGSDLTTCAQFDTSGNLLPT